MSATAYIHISLEIQFDQRDQVMLFYFMFAIFCLFRSFNVMRHHFNGILMQQKNGHSTTNKYRIEGRKKATEYMRKWKKDTHSFHRPLYLSRNFFFVYGLFFGGLSFMSNLSAVKSMRGPREKINVINVHNRSHMHWFS